MKPKEKAEELISKFTKLDIEIGGQFDGYLTMKIHDAKQCAIIAVDEILQNYCGTNTDGQQAYKEEIYCDEYFWHDVKSELSQACT